MRAKPCSAKMLAMSVYACETPFGRCCSVSATTKSNAFVNPRPSDRLAALRQVRETIFRFFAGLNHFYLDHPVSIVQLT